MRQAQGMEEGMEVESQCSRMHARRPSSFPPTTCYCSSLFTSKNLLHAHVCSCATCRPGQKRSAPPSGFQRLQLLPKPRGRQIHAPCVCIRCPLSRCAGKAWNVECSAHMTAYKTVPHRCEAVSVLQKKISAGLKVPTFPVVPAENVKVRFFKNLFLCHEVRHAARHGVQ